MATFQTPTPTSRRSSRLGSRPPGYSPPVVQPRRQRQLAIPSTGQPSRLPTSRLTTPARNTVHNRVPDDISISSDGAAGMDVDDEATSLIFERAIRTEIVFAKSQQLAVSFYSNLPVEVKQILKNSDFYRDSYSGDVDPLTGFALVASAQTCFVWNHAQALSGTPTCYIFACPLSDSAPFHVLIPTGPNREPGLILASIHGELRLWGSIGIGLAGGEHYTTTELPLQADDGELLTTLTRIDSQTFVASTSFGRLFRLTLGSTGGKYHLTSHVFSRPQSSLSLTRIFPLWSSNPQTDRGYINSVALGHATSTGREIWVAVDTRIQLWSLRFEGYEELISEEDLGESIREAIREFTPATSRRGSGVELDVELLDVVLESSSRVVLLVSYAGVDDENSMVVSNNPRRIYALVRFSHTTNTFAAEDAIVVPYQSTSSSGAPMHPRIQSVRDGALIAIQFGDAIALCARDTEYMDRLELRNSTDRTLGLGVLPSAGGELLVLTAATMMKVYVDMDQIAKFDRETGRATLIKSIMTQAILYGSNLDNPLNFSFPPEVDGNSLMTGAEQLSKAILESDSEIIRPNHDLNAHMIGRKDKLNFLIKFINDNAALSKMSQSSRQRLSTDAEKLHAAHQVWLRHNEFLAGGNRRSILTEAVYAYMKDTGEGHHDDFMRAFFRLRVHDIGEITSWILPILNRVRAEAPSLPALGPTLAEANRIVLTILSSATEHRKYNLSLYGVELPVYDPWTAQMRTINQVIDLFELTTNIVHAHKTNGSVDAVTEGMIKMQMVELASVLFKCCYDRLEWLKSPRASSDGAAEREKVVLGERFDLLRPQVLEALRKQDHAQYAFQLAEDYLDFRNLASLCHTESVYPPENNPSAARIHSYIDKFKEAFTTELYQWYIEHGELRTMFAQDGAYDEYVDRFFADNSHPNISWINDVGKHRYGAAANALFGESRRAADLETKHLILSIGKLSQLAQMQGRDESTSTDKSVLDAFDDGLDTVAVQEDLVQQFKAVKPPTRAKQSFESQVDTILKAKATRLARRPAHSYIFKQLLRQLLQGKALSDEELVDLLSLKDNDETLDDFYAALHILAGTKDLPESRQLHAFRSVCRRIYLHDDWDSIRQTMDVTDDELTVKYQSTALYATLACGPKCVLEPNRALAIPSTTDIASRWPGLPPDQVEAVEKDFLAESEELEGLKLENDYKRVKELVAQDAERF